MLRLAKDCGRPEVLPGIATLTSALADRVTTGPAAFPALLFPGPTAPCTNPQPAFPVALPDPGTGVCCTAFRGGVKVTEHRVTVALRVGRKRVRAVPSVIPSLSMPDWKCLVLGVRMLPFLLLGVPAGAVADRFDRRHLVSIVNIAMAVLIAALGLLIMRDMVDVWRLAAFGFAGGCLRALNMPARQSLAFDIVGGSNVVNGIALMSMGMRVGAIAGSLAAGSLMDRLGADVACAALAVGYVLSAITIVFIRDRGQAAPIERESVWVNLKGFWSELRHNPSLQILVVLAAMSEILGFSHQVLMPTFAKDILNVGAEGPGRDERRALRWRNPCHTTANRHGRRAAQGSALPGGVLLLFGASLVFLGFSETFYVAILAITLVNGFAALSDILSQSLAQSVVPNEFRGRAMGSWTLAVGMGPLGHVQIGALASAFGVTFALATHGVGLLILAAGSLALFPRLRRL